MLEKLVIDKRSKLITKMCKLWTKKFYNIGIYNINPGCWKASVWISTHRGQVQALRVPLFRLRLQEQPQEQPAASQRDDASRQGRRVQLLLHEVLQKSGWGFNQGMPKGEVSLYRWSPVWRYSDTGGQFYSDTSPFSIPCLNERLMFGLSFQL